MNRESIMALRQTHCPQPAEVYARWTPYLSLTRRGPWWVVSDSAGYLTATTDDSIALALIKVESLGSGLVRELITGEPPGESNAEAALAYEANHPGEKNPSRVPENSVPNLTDLELDL